MDKPGLKYWMRFALTILGAGAAGYTQGEILGAIIAACAAGAGLLQQSPGDLMREQEQQAVTALIQKKD
jgi:hypothetical protein